MKLFNCLICLFFANTLSAQEINNKYDIPTQINPEVNYIKITNGKYVFWINETDLIDEFSAEDEEALKQLYNQYKEVVSMEEIASKISWITQDVVDIDEEVRTIILVTDDVLIERVVDGDFVQYYSIDRNKRIYKLLDDKGNQILSEWEKKYISIGNPSF